MSDWKSINDGLPPVGAALIVTILDGFRGRRELRYPVVYRKAFYSDNYAFYQYGAEENLLTSEYSPVLAWMELPLPYDGEKE